MNDIQKILYFKILLVLGFAVAFSVFSGCKKTNEAQEPNVNKETVMTTYRTIFANSHRGCFINVVSDGSGHVHWKKELNLEESQIPKNLLIWSGHIVLETLSSISLFDENGNKSWMQPKNHGSFTVIGDQDIFYQDEYYGLNAVSIQNTFSLEDSYFPGATNQEFPVALFYPDKDDYISVVQYVPDNEEKERFLQVIKAEYGERLPKWAERKAGVQNLSPLFIPELDRLFIYTQDVVCIDIQQGKEMPRFKIPLDELTDWSADAEGTLCIIGYEGDKKVILAMSLTGEEKWQWMDPDKSDRWVTGQPPIRSGSQRVYALTGNRVLAIEQGNLLWQYQVNDETLRHGSSLADGSLLVTAGKTLIHLNLEGFESMMVSLEDEILTPPVVDADGNIYVATATHLVKIK